MKPTTLVRALIHLLCIIILASIPVTALAVQVTNLNDIGSGSLRQAVADTSDGGFVTFQSGLNGTITLSSGQITVNKALTIDGPGYSLITIKAGSASRIFNVLTGTKFTVLDVTLQGSGGTLLDDGGLIRSLVDLTIDDCVLEDGRALDEGGAIYLSGGELNCYDSILQNNISSGGHGGAIRLEDSTASFYISRTTFFYNAAYGSGGALSVSNVSSGSLYSCTVHQNEAVTGNGGAVSVVSGDLNVNITSIFSNKTTAGHGGGIYTSGCDLDVWGGSQISSNTAAGAGGGIYSSGGSIRYRYSTLAGNTASGHYNGAGGGGIAQFGGVGSWPLYVTDSTISGNQATDYLGGGVYSEASANIFDSTFHNNQSGGNGGGLYFAGASMTMERSTFSRNISGGAGGGLCLPNVGANSMYLLQNTFWYNEADTNGGGIETGRTTYLYACTITENLADGDHSATGDGGGVHATGALHVHGSIIAGNILEFAGGMTSDDDCAASGTNSGTYSLLGVGVGCNGIVNGVDGNIVGSTSAVVHPYLSGLADNGGPTQTCALYKGSPARDAFLSCTSGGSDTFTMDQRGRPRPRGSACDMGAFEAGASAEGVMYLLINDQI